MNALEQVCRWVDENQSEVVDYLAQLIKLPSVNPWFYGYTTDDSEQAVQERLAQGLRGMGFAVELWETSAASLKQFEGMPGYYENRPMKNRPILCATWNGTGAGRSILLTGHADVVKPGDGWTREPFGAQIEDGKLYGRGAVDMKGGIAAMIMSVRAIQQCGIHLKGDVLVGTVPDEEAGGMGTLDFVHHGIHADGAIMTEPTNLELGPMCRGILWGKIVIPARAGHIEMAQGDWRQGGAVDGVKLMQLYLEQIDKLNLLWAQHKTHPLLPMPCQILVSQVKAGEYPSAFAGGAEISFDAQYLPRELDEHYSGSKVKLEIERFVAEVAAQNDWLLENPPHVEWLLDADCAETPVDGDFVQVLARAAAKLTGETQITGVGSHTDMGWYVHAGIPTVNFGAGDPKIAHQADEYIELADYTKSVKLLAAMVLDWCGEEQGG